MTTQPPIDKKWAVIYADRVLLEAPTKKQLQQKMGTRLPEGHEVCAMPKAYHSVVV